MLETQFAFPNFLKNKVFILMMIMVASIAVGLAGTLDPLILVGGVAALYLLIVFVKWPDLTVIFVAFMIYTNITVVMNKFHGAPKVFGYVLPLLLLVPLIWHLIVHNRKLRINFVLVLMIAYFSIILLGSVFSRDINIAIPNVINFVVEGIGLYFLFTNTIRTSKLLKQVVWSLLIAGALMGGLSLFQQLTGTFDNDYGGFARMEGHGFATGETIQGEVIQHRQSGPIGEKNRYAQIMSLLVPVGLFQAWGADKKLRWTAFLLTGLIFVGASLAFSRGAQVAFLFLIILMTFMRYIKIRQLLIILLGIILLLLAFPQNRARFVSLGGIFSSKEEGGIRNTDGSIQGRATEMLAALLVFRDHPLIGVGPGMFRYEVEEYSRIVSLKNITSVREAHSLYLGLAAEAGILGLITWMGIFLYTLYRLAISRSYWLERKKSTMANLCTGFFLAIISYMTTGLFLHLSYLRFLSLILALAAVASEFTETESTEELAEPDTAETLFLQPKSPKRL